MSREPKVIDHGDWEERIFDDGTVLRVGMSADQQHAFYGAYQPRAINSWHRGSPAELIETERKRRQAKE
jgi:hypothetical protein